MAPVGPRRNASAQRSGLQLPDSPAARRARALPGGGHLVRPVLGGRRSQGSQVKGPRPRPLAAQRVRRRRRVKHARLRGSQYFSGRWHMPGDSRAQEGGRPRVGQTGSQKRKARGEGRAGSAKWLRVGWWGCETITSLGEVMGGKGR